MSLFSAPKSPISQQSTRLWGYRVQTSVYGRGIPIIYGTTRVSGNVIWTGDWQAVEAKQGGKGGGKGSGSGKGGSQDKQYTYRTALMIGLCQGPVEGILSVWQDRTQMKVYLIDEAYTISGGTHNVGQKANFFSDLGVSRSDAYSVTANDHFSPGQVTLSGTQGTPMQRVGGSPGAGQYSVNNGTYTFSGADSGKHVVIHYSWTPPGTTASGQPLTDLNLALFTGDSAQTPWGFLTTNHPDQALTYPKLCYVANESFDLGSSGMVSNLSFEIMSPIHVGGGVLDANPADIIEDALTNPDYGVRGFTVGDLPDYTTSTVGIGTTSELRTYCQANGIFLSPMFDQQSSAASVLEEILTLSNAAAVWSEGLLKIRSYGDTTAVGNGATYVPNTAPIFDLNDDDFLCDPGQSPVSVERPTVRDAYNVVGIEWLNRANGYNPEPLSESDDVAIGLYTRREQAPITAHSVCDQRVAQKVVSTMLQRSVNIRSKVKFRLPATYILLEPMDIVTIPSSWIYMSPGTTPVRILSIEEDENFNLSVEAEEFPWSVSGPTLHPKQAASNFGPGFFADPGVVNTPVFFEAPAELTQGVKYQMWIAISGGQNWGGCTVHMSTDRDTYTVIGKQVGGAGQGTLAAPLPLSPIELDTTHTLSVDMTESVQPVEDSNHTLADQWKSLAIVGYEVVAYGDVTLTGSNTYDLQYLHRGVVNTFPADHAAGEQFVALDDRVFVWEFDDTDIGETRYFKFTSFNQAGAMEQELSTAVEYSIVVGAIPPSITFTADVSPADPSAIEIANLTFPVNPNKPDFYQITAGTFNIYFQDATFGGYALQTGITAVSPSITTSVTPSQISAGDYIQIGNEILECGAPSGNTIPVSRGQAGSTAASASTGANVRKVAIQTATATYPPGFFATPDAATWVLDQSMPGALVLSVVGYLTNQYGNSPSHAICLTNNSDHGLQLATGSGAAPPPLLPSSVTAAEHVSERTLEGDVTITPIYVDIVRQNNDGATWKEVWLHDPAWDAGVYGASEWKGAIDDQIIIWRFVPDVDTPGYTVRVITGNEQAQNDPANGTVSNTFTLQGLGLPPANSVIQASLGNLTYGSDADGSRYWGIDQVQWSILKVANMWTTRLLVQKGAVIGGIWTPAPSPDPEGLSRPVIEQDAPGQTVTFPINYWTIPPAGSPYRTYRFWIEAKSRKTMSGYPWVLQTVAWGGVDHRDITPAPVTDQVPNTPPANPTGVTAVEHPTERILGPSQVTRTPIYVTLSGPMTGATWAEVWLHDPAWPTGTFGAGEWIGPVTEQIIIWRDAPPLTTGGYIVKAITGNDGAQNDPTTGVQSASFSLQGLGDPTDHCVTNATVGTIIYGKTDDGTAWWGIDKVQWTITKDPNFYTSRLLVQRGRYNNGVWEPIPTSGTPGSNVSVEGNWRPIVEADNAGDTFSVPIAYWLIPPSDSLYKIFKFAIEARSRRSDLAYPWVRQNTCWPGATWFADVTPAGQGGVLATPGNVTIGTPQIDDAGGGTVAVTVPYTPPAGDLAFTGVQVEIEAPDQSSTPATKADGTSPWDGTTAPVGDQAPLSFGPFAYSSSQGMTPRVKITLDAPDEQQQARIRLRSVSRTVVNDAATSPTTTVTLAPTVPAYSPLSASAYTAMATWGVSPFSVTAPYELSGKLEQDITFSGVVAPNDPNFSGWEVWSNGWPDDPQSYQMTGTLNDTSTTVTVDAPSSVIAVKFWLVSVNIDATGSVNRNPIVPGITPLAVVTLGTADGVLDLSKVLSTSFNSAEFTVDPVTLKWTQKGVDMTKAIDGTFSQEFDASGNQFSMKAIDLGKALAGSFPSSQFTTNSGVFSISALSANLISTGILEVGGQSFGNPRVSRLKVFDTTVPVPTLIGWVGDDSAGSGYVGAWFKRCRIGGTDPGSAKIVADDAGNVAISGSLIVGTVAAATFAGTSAVFSGTITCSQVIAGTFIGHSLQVSAGGITTYLNSMFSSTLGVWIGFRCQEDSSQKKVEISPDRIEWTAPGFQLVTLATNGSGGAYYGSLYLQTTGSFGTNLITMDSRTGIQVGGGTVLVGQVEIRPDGVYINGSRRLSSGSPIV
jgi:hypothetical protein